MKDSIRVAHVLLSLRWFYKKEPGVYFPESFSPEALDVNAEQMFTVFSNSGFLMGFWLIFPQNFLLCLGQAI